MTQANRAPNVLKISDLPYDIRYLIYEHLFPPNPQLYIIAQSSGYAPITPKCPVATGLFRVNRALGREACEHFYNRYLFNVIGTKHDCLVGYKPFLKTLKKYALNRVRVDAFGNGWPSQTMCISLQAGESKLPVLRSRRRGVPMNQDEMQNEMAEIEKEKKAEKTFIPLLDRIAYCARESHSWCKRHSHIWSLSEEAGTLFPAMLFSVLILLLALGLKLLI